MQHHVNILFIIFTYYIEALEITAGITAWATIYVMTIQPCPFYMAQIFIMITWAVGTTAFILNCAVSLLKILFVTNFDFVFAQNPEILGKKLLTFSLILGFVPQCLTGMYQTANGVLSTSAVVFLMGMIQTKEVAPLMRMYGYIWLFASLLMLITTLLFIPFYVKMNHQVMALAENRMEEETVHFRFGKMLVVGVLVAICSVAAIENQAAPMEGGIPLPILIPVIGICLILLFFVFENKVWKYGKMQLFSRVQTMVVVLTEIFNCEFGLLKHNRISPHVETSGAHSKVDSSVKITTPEPQLEIIPDKTAIGTHNKVDSSVKIDTHATQQEINPDIISIGTGNKVNLL